MMYSYRPLRTAEGEGCLGLLRRRVVRSNLIRDGGDRFAPPSVQVVRAAVVLLRVRSEAHAALGVAALAWSVVGRASKSVVSCVARSGRGGALGGAVANLYEQPADGMGSRRVAVHFGRCKPAKEEERESSSVRARA